MQKAITYKNIFRFFVRSGDAYISKGYLISAGQSGGLASSSADISNRMYTFGLNNTEVFPSGGPYVRYHGFSLRCLQENENNKKVRSGYTNVFAGFMSDTGSNAHYWSRAGNSEYAFYLYFTISWVNPSTGPRNRFFGFSLRCLQE